MPDHADIETRLLRLENESAIQCVFMSYGPAADSGWISLAANHWLADGEYDSDANREPHHGPAAVGAMLKRDAHRHLMSEGMAHFGGPPAPRDRR